jgi:hypothetical protein
LLRQLRGDVRRRSGGDFGNAKLQSLFQQCRRQSQFMSQFGGCGDVDARSFIISWGNLCHLFSVNFSPILYAFVDVLI